VNWKTRIANNCLFIDDLETGRVVLQHNSRPGMRPYIHPLRGVDEQTCLTEDSPWHHPWQHGIQTGYHGVNGCDFWFDPGQNAKVEIGTIEPSSPEVFDAGEPSWLIQSAWRHSNGSELLREKQTWSLRHAEDVLLLDLVWTITAIPYVTIEQGSYGGLFIRMPFRSDRDTKVVNSSGLEDDATEQQPAAWVDLRMPVNKGDVLAGITLLDHVANPRHPAHWRVDGQRGINPSPCIPREITLSADEEMTHRYRMVLHDGTLVIDRIEELWESFGNE
ncbi:MAG TPA: hypothetical protein DHW45_00850, partial [Candidatus Latescibacteria bacterium]|nr:hypothetical protein [Candidatus Latescibacterota bacterium]